MCYIFLFKKEIGLFNKHFIPKVWKGEKEGEIGNDERLKTLGKNWKRIYGKILFEGKLINSSWFCEKFNFLFLTFLRSKVKSPWRINIILPDLFTSNPKNIDLNFFTQQVCFWVHMDLLLWKENWGKQSCDLYGGTLSDPLFNNHSVRTPKDPTKTEHSTFEDSKGHLTVFTHNTKF